MAEEENNIEEEILKPSFPLGRVKKIMKLDKDINKVNSEALLLIALSTDLFLQFLAEKSSEVAMERKRKTIKLDCIRIAATRHQPTGEFLLDSLPVADEPVNRASKAVAGPAAPVEKPLPVGTRRIDGIFKKSVTEAV